MADLDAKREALRTLIRRYHSNQAKIFTETVKDACDLAESRVKERIDRSQDEEIEKLKKALNEKNKNESNVSLLIDLVFSIALTPLAGMVVDKLVEKSVDLISKYREDIIEIAHEIDKINGYKDSWNSVLPDSLTPSVSKQLETVLATPSRQAINDLPKMSMKAALEHFTPMIKSKADSAADKAKDKLKEKFDPAGEDPVKELYKKWTDANQLPLSDILDGCQNYKNAQLSIVDANEDVALWLANNMPHEIFLDALANDFSSKLRDLPRFDDRKLKRDIASLMEAVMWIYYLGKPEGWGFARYPAAAKPSDYFPTSAGRTDTYEGGAYATTLAWQNGTAHPVFAYNIQLPQSLFTYLLTKFTPSGSDDNFLDDARKKKQGALGRKDGPGIDTRDPRAGWTTTPPFNYAQASPDKPINDPSSVDYNAYDLASYNMVQWFRTVEKSLAEGERQMGALLSGLGVKTVERVF